MRKAIIALAALTLMAVPAAADKDTVIDVQKLETSVWAVLSDVSYYLAVSDSDERLAALARFQQDASDFTEYLEKLDARLGAADKGGMLLDGIGSTWLELKEMTDAILADAKSGGSGALLDEQLKAAREKTIEIEGQIEVLAEELGD